MPKSIDYYGHSFEHDDIQNRDNVDVEMGQGIDAFTSEEIKRNAVLIDDQHGKKLYLRSMLKTMLKNNRYTRLPDPLTRADLIEQLPDFKAVVVNFEQHAADYNAYVLEKYPEFVEVLKKYVEIVLHPDDAHRYITANREDIVANNSAELNAIYETIRGFDLEKAAAFHSLFITNRDHFSSPQHRLFEFPAKWIRSEQNSDYYDHYTDRTQEYKPYPHRNVHVGDAFEHTDAACMHSWGMDILHLLVQYHIGMNKSFRLFTQEEMNPLAYHMERALCQRILQNETSQGSLVPTEGERAFAAVRNFANCEPTFSKLDKTCRAYMDHLLKNLKHIKNTTYPGPEAFFAHPAKVLVTKYKAVYEMYAALHENERDRAGCIEGFLRLYGERKRHETITSHRDSVGVRFLNILCSLLSLGVKNLVTYYKTDRNYAGFWRSRGGSFAHDVSGLLNDTRAVIN